MCKKSKNEGYINMNEHRYSSHTCAHLVRIEHLVNVYISNVRILKCAMSEVQASCKDVVL